MRRLGKENARGLGAIIGAGRNDGRAAIVGIVVQSREPAEDPRGFARNHDVGAG